MAAIRRGMNYYPFHLGDYTSHTAHLTPMEDICYRRMLDLYYIRETHLPEDHQQIARLIRMSDSADIVKAVLNEFFQLLDDGYHNGRADREIASFKRMAEGGKRGAEKRWSKPSDSQPIASPSPPQSNPNANQNQYQNHKPINGKGSRLPTDWKPNTEEIAYCKQTRPDLDPTRVAEDFADYWHAIPGSKGVKLDWSATWRGWVRKQFASGKKHAEETREWHETVAGIDAKARELGLPLKDIDEQFPSYKARVMKAEKGVSHDTGFKTVADLWDIAQARKKA